MVIAILLYININHLHVSHPFGRMVITMFYSLNINILFKWSHYNINRLAGCLPLPSLFAILKNMAAKTWDEIYGEGAGKEIAPVEPLPDFDINDTETCRKLLSEELWGIVRANRGKLNAIPAIRELWDRTEGKPSQKQSIDMNVTGALDVGGERTEAEAIRRLEFIFARAKVINATPSDDTTEA